MFNELFELSVRRGHQTYVDLACLGVSEPPYLFFLQHSKNFGLQGGTGIRDFVGAGSGTELSQFGPFLLQFAGNGLQLLLLVEVVQADDNVAGLDPTVPAVSLRTIDS